LENDIRGAETEPNVIKHNKTPVCAFLRAQESLALKTVSAVLPKLGRQTPLPEWILATRVDAASGDLQEPNFP
jgi:hypothetical protein